LHLFSSNSVLCCIPSMAAEIDPMVTDMFIQCRNVLSLAALQNSNQIKQVCRVLCNFFQDCKTGSSASRRRLTTTKDL